MSHSASWWSRDTSDEADNWLASSVVLLQEIGSLLLSRSSDLSDHDDTISLTILKEDSQAVDEVGSGEWVTADTDDEGLAKTALGGLVDGLVGEGSGTRNDADAAALVDETWHDTDLALAWGDDTWAVRADQAGLVLGLQDVGDADHVVLWDTLGDAGAVLEAVRYSCAGGYQAYQTTSGISAAMASSIPAAATGGGTKMADAFAPPSFIACATVAQTGRSRCVSPAFFGFVPPTTFVPRNPPYQSCSSRTLNCASVRCQHTVLNCLLGMETVGALSIHS